MNHELSVQEVIRSIFWSDVSREFDLAHFNGSSYDVPFTLACEYIHGQEKKESKWISIDDLLSGEKSFPRNKDFMEEYQYSIEDLRRFCENVGFSDLYLALGPAGDAPDESYRLTVGIGDLDISEFIYHVADFHDAGYKDFVVTVPAMGEIPMSTSIDGVIITNRTDDREGKVYMVPMIPASGNTFAAINGR